MPLSPASLQGPGRLTVHLTLHGDAFALRYQAKAGGYTWTGKEWQREISTAVLGEGATEMDLGRERLLGLARAEAAMFTCASSLDTPVLSA
ncbi:hypothetical protein SAMN00790413_05218 [Deinococcus hopiensis KR-140]|uniref:Uncharacterized protein n=1 Tax=Deinococcus hopiensis KR-140 TaxID=695939 RepID=A0A1W1UU78_9DEIO|nr:hypothetical protein SAMN00790413_05218 [Deinococcus hopiensis KR-140]